MTQQERLEVLMKNTAKLDQLIASTKVYVKDLARVGSVHPELLLQLMEVLSRCDLNAIRDMPDELLHNTSLLACLGLLYTIHNIQEEELNNDRP